jgi:MoaA/NifB/PqqE/SkfB family radical SAM enzyme
MAQQLTGVGTLPTDLAAYTAAVEGEAAHNKAHSPAPVFETGGVPAPKHPVRRRWKLITRRARELWTVGYALAHTGHPVMAQIVPARFCNLSCTYCNEYDKVSEPTPIAEMLDRIDHLARLGTSIITISGGEPLTHPDLDQVIARIRHHGRIAGMITNGYLLMPDRIERLNRAGLDHMQISIDNVMPDETSKKSLKVLDKKLEMLREYADFHVNINSVVGGGIANPQDAITVGRRAIELGFTSTIGIIHDGDGQLKPLGGEERRVWAEMRGWKKTNYSKFNKFQEAIANAEPNDWRCRAGARYLYVCEDGLVHYCSQKRGTPGVPVAEYTKADIRREFTHAKSCAPHCTVSCVHQISYIDHWRAPQTSRSAPGSGEGLVNIEL